MIFKIFAVIGGVVGLVVVVGGGLLLWLSSIKSWE